MEEVVNDGQALYDWYLATHTPWQIFLTIWNFFGSLLLVILAYWRLSDLTNQKVHFNSIIDYHGVKISLILICAGYLHHAFSLEPPSIWNGLIHTGLLIYLLLRRRKQLLDRKEDLKI